MLEPSYFSKKGKRIVLNISDHAIRRFQERWNLMHPDNQIISNALAVMCKISEIFNGPNTFKVEVLSKRDKERLEKYGSDTMFFKNNDFTFIVQNSTIVTVEISTKAYRKKNKPDILKTISENNP
jgi:hypothetical protein